ncbi:MAG: methionyl-tRNA formyltransferase, partial [Ktedonobacterales bacterium]
MRNIIKQPLRVVFMGTPEFAVPPLRALVEHAPPAKLWASGLDMVGVVTRPDKPAGRGRQVLVSSVKRFALDRGIPVYQPGPLRQPEALK